MSSALGNPTGNIGKVKIKSGQKKSPHRLQVNQSQIQATYPAVDEYSLGLSPVGTGPLGITKTASPGINKQHFKEDKGSSFKTPGNNSPMHALKNPNNTTEENPKDMEK